MGAVTSSGITTFLKVKDPWNPGNLIDSSSPAGHFVGDQFHAPHKLDLDTMAAVYACLAGLYERMYFAGCGTMIDGEGVAAVGEANNDWDEDEWGGTTKLDFDFSKDGIFTFDKRGGDSIRLDCSYIASKAISSYLQNVYTFRCHRPSWGKNPDIEWATSFSIGGSSGSASWSHLPFGDVGFFAAMRNLFFTFSGAEADNMMGGNYFEAAEKLVAFFRSAWYGESQNDPVSGVEYYYTHPMIEDLSIAVMLQYLYGVKSAHNYEIEARLNRLGFESYCAVLSLYDRIFYTGNFQFTYPESGYWGYTLPLSARGTVPVTVSFDAEAGLVCDGSAQYISVEDATWGDLRDDPPAKTIFPESPDEAKGAYIEKGTYTKSAHLGAENPIRFTASVNVADLQKIVEDFISSSLESGANATIIGTFRPAPDRSAPYGIWFSYEFKISDDSGEILPDQESFTVYLLVSLGSFSDTIDCSVNISGSLGYDVYYPILHAASYVQVSGDFPEVGSGFVDPHLSHPGADAVSCGRVAGSSVNFIGAFRSVRKDTNGDTTDYQYGIITGDTIQEFPYLGCATFPTYDLFNPLYLKMSKAICELLGTTFENEPPKVGGGDGIFAEGRLLGALHGKFFVEDIKGSVSTRLIGTYTPEPEELPDGMAATDWYPSEVTVKFGCNDNGKITSCKIEFLPPFGELVTAEDIPYAVEGRIAFQSANLSPREDKWYSRVGDYEWGTRLGTVGRFQTDFAFRSVTRQS